MNNRKLAERYLFQHFPDSEICEAHIYELQAIFDCLIDEGVERGKKITDWMLDEKTRPYNSDADELTA